jgi:hypothetical protein
MVWGKGGGVTHWMEQYTRVEDGGAYSVAAGCLHAVRIPLLLLLFH